MSIFNISTFFLAYVQSSINLDQVGPGALANIPSQQLPHMVRGLVPYEKIFQLTWLLFFVLLVIFLLFLFKKFLGKSKSKTLHKKMTKIELMSVLLKKIKSLDPVSPFSRQKQEDFFYELSFLFRECIELTMELKATDLTFKELESPLKKALNLKNMNSEEILKFLKFSDLIKFSEKESSLERANHFKKDVLSWAYSLEKILISKVREEELQNKLLKKKKRGLLSIT